MAAMSAGIAAALIIASKGKSARESDADHDDRRKRTSKRSILYR